MWVDFESPGGELRMSLEATIQGLRRRHLLQGEIDWGQYLERVADIERLQIRLKEEEEEEEVVGDIHWDQNPLKEETVDMDRSQPRS